MEGREYGREINYFYRIFMKFWRKDKLGLLIDIWNMFLLFNKILDVVVYVRFIRCVCDY